MKKILYVTTIYSTMNFFKKHFETLNKSGFKIDIACNFQKKFPASKIKFINKSHQIDFHRTPLKFQNLKAIKQLKKLIKKENYDIVHTHTPVASVVVRLACKKLRNKGLKVFYTAHGFHFFKGAPLINWLVYYPIEKWLSKYTDLLITMNKEDYNLSKSKFKAKCAEYISGVGIDLQKFKPQTPELKKTLRKKYGYNKNDFIMTYVAELSHRKHQDLLIEVVKDAKKRIPNLKLLLVGIGDKYSEYKVLISDFALCEYVNLLGYRSDVANLMKLSDLSISSSRHEGLPVNVMEAMASGLPLIVSNCRGNRDLVVNNVNGYVVEIEEESQYIEAILKMYNSIETREKFSKASLSMIKKYSLDKILERIKELYIKYE